MKSTSILSLLLSASLSTAFSLPRLANQGQEALLGNVDVDVVENPVSLNVPGENPLTYCSEPNDWILDIDYVDLSPNPPQSGTNLTIVASGTLHEDLEQGAQVALTVKWGLITLIKQTADLCKQVGKVDLECPIKKGPMTMEKDVHIPKEVPPGKYTTIASVVDKDGKQVTCLEAQVYF